MKRLETRSSTLDKMGIYATTLSLIEVGLGSLLHSFKIPFAGHFLSLNQAFLLSRFCTSHPEFEKENKWYPAGLAYISALLKSLSPAGKKLTPMLAIGTQGFLFNLPLRILGNNIFSHIIGTVLLSLWGFLQPLLLYTLLFGENLFFMLNYFNKKFSKVFSFPEESLLIVLALIVLAKIFLGIGLILIVHWMPEKSLESYESKMYSLGKKVKKKKREKLKKVQPTHPFLGALQDLLNPLFLISLVATGVFFYFAKSPLSTTIWNLLRPLGVGFLFFLLLRVAPIENWLKAKYSPVPKWLAPSFSQAVQKIKSL